MSIESIGIIAGIIFAFILFLLGFLLGKLTNIQNQMIGRGSENKPRSFLKDNENNKSQKKIEIDESKFVSDLKVDDFDKNFDELGDKSVENDDISSSVSKLNELKKKRKFKK